MIALTCSRPMTNMILEPSFVARSLSGGCPACSWPQDLPRSFSAFGEQNDSAV